MSEEQDTYELETIDNNEAINDESIVTRKPRRWQVAQQLVQEGESGQSIVLIALAMIVLLAFTGIAVDTGYVFVKQTQLNRAVDAAVLAGVTEILDPSNKTPGDRRAQQFLLTNDIPVDVTIGGNYDSYAETTALGAIQFSVTATWPVELFFLPIVNWDEVRVTEAATAAYFPLTEVYASRRIESGALSTSNQSVFGPYQCSGFGDPFSPISPNWTGGTEYQGFYTYQYRILVPGTYPEDVLRVELFDPDGMNNTVSLGNDTTTIIHTDNAVSQGMSEFEDLGCADNGANEQSNFCLIDTGERNLGLSLDIINPFWFVRVDSNRWNNSMEVNPSLCISSNDYNTLGATQTRYELFYYAQPPGGGQPQRQRLATYYGQTGHNDYDTPADRDNCNADQEAAGLPLCSSRSAGDHNTDLQWVSPGGSRQPSIDNPYGGDTSTVPRNAWVDVPAEFGSFEIDLNSDVPDIIVDEASGSRYIYLDITALNGAGENGFEVWAGPNIYTATTSSNANTRNIQVLDNPGAHSSLGASVFALGRLPMNSNFNNPIDVPLIFVPPSYAGQTIYVSLFDPDTSGTQGPITFYFDSIAFEPDTSHNGYDEDSTDWAMAFDKDFVGGVQEDDDDGEPATARCSLSGNGCNNTWVDPAYRITVPNLTSACPANPTEQEQRDYCTPFYGGILTARYQAGVGDTYTWQIQLTGSPFLVR